MLPAGANLPAHLAALNAAQMAAVTSPASVLQVLAGPGSGKTRVITCRVVHLIKSAKIDPSNIIVATFTNKAANEMKHRIQSMLGSELPSKLIIGTFHATCRKYLINYGHHIKLWPNFRVADAEERLRSLVNPSYSTSKSIIKKIIKKIKSEMDPGTVQARISHLKANNESAAFYEAGLMKTKKVVSEDIAKIYRDYEDELIAHNLLDFDDLLIRMVELLRKMPQCVGNIEHVLIDEYQDTNLIQFDLMSLLASARSVITVVGDPDQSIYGFRSADRRNLKKLLQCYKETETITLEQNYRSTGAILHSSLSLIEQETSRPPKSLQSTIMSGTRPTYRKLRDNRSEGTWLAREINRIVKRTGTMIHYGDIAVLLRSASLSFELERGLGRAGIPYRMAGGKRFFDRAEIKDVMAYLRLINDPSDNSALLRVINVPSRGFGESRLNKLIAESEQYHTSLWTSLKSFIGGNTRLCGRSEDKVRSTLGAFVRTIEGLEKMNGEAIDVLIQQIVQKTRYRQYLEAKNPHDFQEKLDNIKELQEFALDARLREDDLPDIGLERNTTCRTPLGDFLAHISLMSDLVGNSEETAGKGILTISTIHAAKGLEWPVVFVPSIYQGSIPHSRAEDIDEERRLLFVAMTRAQRK
ncbi:ATP-dependent DNA helicase srs2 [Neolecta irregularis DAH-3]|uniref:DNA 3'-5' helicase n=1 Tax=Neolecta irregularis (strain DAH-3) TaxID=1198029 RepID=A0A1U7LMD3_NEOID|nr:ATP-dependent DNA helicase srs2 [Neolecta irregularis DAH-3]|eukprot:OLL23671.1 ATP-dependent DNA helicase srs2 [Neolecta irregularis DAH-3]